MEYKELDVKADAEFVHILDVSELLAQFFRSQSHHEA